jgi:hypothetical protein
MAYQALSPVNTHTHYFTVAIINAQYVKESSILNLLKYVIFQAFNSAHSIFFPEAQTNQVKIK